MTSKEFVELLVQLAVMLLAGVTFGAILRRFRQPSVVGEMAAGVIIGVTVLGSLAPAVYDWIFASSDLVTSTRSDFIKIGMLFFLFVAGSEVDLSDIRTLGRRSLIIGLIGTLLPIAAGIGLVYVTPMSMWGESVGISRLAFSAFIGMNLANSANPVLARILIDLGLMKSRLATVMMTATVIDDLVNWTLYAIILGSVTTVAGSGSDRPLGLDLLLVALLFVGVLGGVRWLAPKLVALARRYLAWPNGYVAVASLTILGISAVSEAIGVQGFLGAFLAGVAFSSVAAGVGATGHKSLTYVSIAFFAPLFFVGMALRVNFIESFDVVLVVTVVVFALVSKLVSVLIGVRAAGLPVGREAWAIAWGLNARGATGIILAATGLQAGIINDEVFVALVVMAIVTSLLAGPMMVRALGPLRAQMVEEPEDLEEEVPSLAATARMLDGDLTEAERADLESSILYRVMVAIDDPATADPLVELAADLACSQQPAEVILVAFRKQDSVEDRMHSALDEIATELDSLRGLEAIVQARGVAAVSISQRSTDLAADIAAKAHEQGAHTLVVGDRRDDPDWVSIVDALIARSPTDIHVVVAPRPRGERGPLTGGPVLEVGAGLPGDASLEAAVRIALAGSTGPVIVGLSPKAKAAARYRQVLDRLAGLGRPGRIEESKLDTIEGAAAVGDATFVIRSFSAPEGLRPIERARPDAERFDCPIVLVAPDPNRPERVSLDDLLDAAEAAATPTI
jgi:Kef-type K+ transport system membrane component KefB